MCPKEGHVWGVEGPLLLLTGLYLEDCQPKVNERAMRTASQTGLRGEKGCKYLPLVLIVGVSGDNLNESLMCCSTREIGTVHYQFPLTFTTLIGFLVSVICYQAKRIWFSYSSSETELEKWIRQTWPSPVHTLVRFHFTHTKIAGLLILLQFLSASK